MNGAVRTRTAYKIKGIDIVLEVGQVAASDVELAEFLGCNRKTVGKLIDSFNRLGMLTTRTNNRTSVHSLHFLTLVCWRCPCHQSPLCQTFGYRQRTDGRCADTCFRQSASWDAGDAAIDCHTRGKETDSLTTGAASLPSSLLLSGSSNPSADVHDGGSIIRRLIFSWRTQLQIGTS